MCVAVVGSLPADGMRYRINHLPHPHCQTAIHSTKLAGMDIEVMCCETRMSSRSEFEDLGWIADTMDQLSQS